VKNIKEQARQSNICSESLKKAHDKMYKDLTMAMNSVKAQEDNIDFDLLGKFMNCIGVYKIIFNSSYTLRLNQDGEIEETDPRYKSNSFLRRASGEAKFHKTFCELLNYMEEPLVNSELVIEILMILYNIIDCDLYELENNIKQLLDIYYKDYRLQAKILEEVSNKNWNVKGIVKAFKELNDGKHMGELYNFNKTLRIPQNTQTKFPFKPTIDEFSKTLLGKYMSKCESQGEELKSRKADSIENRIAEMYEKEKRKEEKLRLEREKKAIEEVKGCTFKPLLKAKAYPESSTPITKVYIKNY